MDTMNKEIMEALGFDHELAMVSRGRCPFCAHPVGEFRDALSEREFAISGLCQDCQDKTFGE